MLSTRLLTLLQFTRAALVFTALADTLCAMLLQAGSVGKLNVPHTLIALTASGCLYAFGMALNDLVDHRRDALLAANRPIPSGRLGVYTAHIIVTALAVASLAFGSLYAFLTQSPTSFVLLLLTLLLINFYNFAGKYLVSAGILTLGLVRFTHAITFAPDVPVLWHPLWLFTHIVITTAVAYVWEEKRPRITQIHSTVLYAGVLVTNVSTVAIVLSLRSADTIPHALSSLTLSPALLIPIIATFGFAYLVRRIAQAVGTMQTVPGMGVTESATSTHASVMGTGAVMTADDPATPAAAPLRARRRQAGQRLMLSALLCLIVYDAAFVLGYVGVFAGCIVLALLPLAWFSVRLMRASAQLIALTKAPQFRRATNQ